MSDDGLLLERIDLLKGSGNAWIEKQEEKTDVLDGDWKVETHSIKGSLRRMKCYLIMVVLKSRTIFEK
jgi:hypothetical protein